VAQTRLESGLAKWVRYVYSAVIGTLQVCTHSKLMKSGLFGLLFQTYKYENEILINYGCRDLSFHSELARYVICQVHNLFAE
jgi:hypothetical protein